MGDRAQDNWRTLIAIADLIGEDWAKIARTAAVALSSSSKDNEPTRTMLLSDIRDIFGEDDAKPTKVILAGLHEMETRPWAEWGKRKQPMSDVQLANQLRPFGIKPTTLNRHGERVKGYKLEAFAKAFAQYLKPLHSAPPHVQPVTPLPFKESGAYSDFQPVTLGQKVTGRIAPNPAETANGNGVTGRDGGSGVARDDLPPNDDDIEREPVGRSYEQLKI